MLRNRGLSEAWCTAFAYAKLLLSRPLPWAEFHPLAPNKLKFSRDFTMRKFLTCVQASMVGIFFLIPEILLNRRPGPFLLISRLKQDFSVLSLRGPWIQTKEKVMINFAIFVCASDFPPWVCEIPGSLSLSLKRNHGYFHIMMTFELDPKYMLSPFIENHIVASALPLILVAEQLGEGTSVTCQFWEEEFSKSKHCNGGRAY